jgi:hypothetical protein
MAVCYITSRRSFVKCVSCPLPIILNISWFCCGSRPLSFQDLDADAVCTCLSRWSTLEECYQIRRFSLLLVKITLRPVLVLNTPNYL